MQLLPFTPFQQVFRQWEPICPQNSAQAMLVEGTPDPEVIENAWQSTLRDMGLGLVHVDLEEGGYSHEIWSGNPPGPLVCQLAGQDDIFAYVQGELGRAFPASPTMPYRAFAVQGENECWLGIVYQQWVADSVAIRLLMREWFHRIFFPAKARRKLIDLPRLRIARGPGLERSPMQMYRALKYVYQWTRRAKQITTFEPGGADYGVEVRPLSLAPELLHDLLMLTRAEGCTLNDLLMAGIACTLDRHLRHRADGRLMAAIATSIDLRPYLPGDLSETFGSLLAYAPVVCSLPAGNRLDLAQEIARQTRQLKDPEYIAQYLLLPRLMSWWAQRKEPAGISEFYRRNAAISASVANVNLGKSWAALFYPAPLKQYIRVAAPNPATPLSISASTLGDRLDMVVSSQRATLSSDTAERITVDLAGELNLFAAKK